MAEKEHESKILVARLGFWTSIITLLTTVMDKYSGIIGRLLARFTPSEPAHATIPINGEMVPRVLHQPMTLSGPAPNSFPLHMTIALICVVLAIATFFLIKRWKKA